MAKFCKNCKYYQGPYTGMECLAPQNLRPIQEPKYTPVDGILIPQAKVYWHTAQVLRESNLLAAVLMNTCGKAGRWFVSKENNNG